VRFHPTRWIVLDELSGESDTRFLSRRLPLLRDYHFVTSSTGGFLVLADREPPHAARVLNAFTGSLTRFKAPMPSEMHMAAEVVGPSPTLVVLSTWGTLSADNLKFFLADPGSERFFDVGLGSSSAVSRTDDALPEFLYPVASALLVLCGVAVDLGGPGGEMLRVDRFPEQGVRLFRMNSEGRAMERVHSIGSHALFLGTFRSMSIHADVFPSVNANCIYYKKVEEEEDGSSHTYEYDLAHDKEEKIAEVNI
jgi:hypothetical protein